MKQTAMLTLSCQYITLIWSLDQTESYVRKQHWNKKQSLLRMERMKKPVKADQSATIVILTQLQYFLPSNMEHNQVLNCT